MHVLNDFDTNLKRALTEIDSNWNSYNGLVICGTHTPHHTEEMIDLIKNAREKQIPFLGICFGHQLAAIEYARNVWGIKDATSEEFGTGTFVVEKRKDLNIGHHNGESYWNNYEVTIDWDKPKHFITTQYHPEYESRKDKPHPLLIQFLTLCKESNVDGRQV